MKKLWYYSSMQLYRESVYRDHKTRIVRAGFSIYAWFWFHTEALWIKNTLLRRPYTYIFRDWLYPHMKWFLTILAVWYIGMLVWMHWNPYPPAILMALSSWLSAHLVWGSRWKKGEQEWPVYMGEK